MRTKNVILILVAVLTVVLGALAFLIGMMLGGKPDGSTQTAEQTVTTAAETEPVTETKAVTTLTTATETTATETTAAETSAVTTTEITAAPQPKPTITKAYMYYYNTAVGCRLYLHVEGDYAGYQYKVYHKTPYEAEHSLAYEGENNVQEFLVQDGIGGAWWDTFKASVTAWNQDKSQSVETWAYVDLSLCSDGSPQPEAVTPAQSSEAVPPSPLTHLFGGYVATETAKLNLRKEPNTNSEILDQIPAHMQLDIYAGGKNGWYWTYYNGKGGYVSADYIKEIPPYDGPGG